MNSRLDFFERTLRLLVQHRAVTIFVQLLFFFPVLDTLLKNILIRKILTIPLHHLVARNTSSNVEDKRQQLEKFKETLRSEHKRSS